MRDAFRQEILLSYSSGKSCPIPRIPSVSPRLREINTKKLLTTGSTTLQ